MSKIIDQIKKINLVEKFALDSKKIVLILIISVIFLYLDFNYLLKAQVGGVKKSADEIIKLQNDLKALDLGLKNMRDLKSQQKNQPQSKVKRTIIDSELASLLQDISKFGNANNVEILQIKPYRDTQKAAAALKFSPVFISLDLVAGYHNLGKFINDLENSQTLISLENFKIEARPGDSLKQRATLTLKTYVQR